MTTRYGLMLLGLFTDAALVLVSPAAGAGWGPHEELIGKPAPEFTADYTINGNVSPLPEIMRVVLPGFWGEFLGKTGPTLAPFTGKVVLLHFGGFWCQPCSHTLPHLKKWNWEYKDKGLEVVGVTSYWESLGFDKDKGRAVRLDKKLSAERERAVLKDFIAHHNLEYRLAMVPQADWEKLLKAYEIEGFPHLVLIDRKGDVRMVRMGCADETFEAIEAKLKELLAEEE